MVQQRQELRKRLNESCVYSAEFGGVRLDKGIPQFRGVKYPIGRQHIKLINVHIANGPKCADHIWIDMTSKLNDFILEKHLEIGDKIVFTADVRPYINKERKESETLNNLRNIRIVIDSQKPIFKGPGGRTY